MSPPPASGPLGSARSPTGRRTDGSHLGPGAGVPPPGSLVSRRSSGRPVGFRAPASTDAVFAALADPTRRRILEAVASTDGLTATDAAADLPVSRQAVVKHLQALADAGLVAAERHGREQRYRITPGPLTGAMAWMADVGAAWDERLARLRTRLEH
jgi:ArsR family transcriptional regulator, cadmium/lead-responsive transcriptional repressor